MLMSYQRKKLVRLKTSLFVVLMAVFAMPLKAQNVYMHTGSMTVPSSGTVNFYDSGGESHGPDYYWERWFQRNEEFTFTFNPAETGKKIKVTFNEFTAYLDNGGYNHAIGNTWSMRLNTAELSVYDGTEVDEANLITTYTGNMTGAFSVIANGPITFYFHSYGYREEGWQATVQCVDNYELQKPQISFEACSDAIVINANNKGAEIYYTTNGNDPVVADPLTGAILYEGPFNVEAGTTIKAIARINNTNSDVASKQFTANDVTPTPGVPTITREDNTITMTPAAISEEINETYYVWYTTDGTEPTATNGQRYNAPFEWHTPQTTFKAVTRASSCGDKLSEVIEFTFEDVKVPTPTITFPNGNATIDCTMTGVTIYYTTDGSTPTTSSTPYTAPFAVSYGTTVKAIAVMNQTGFEDSDVASEIYVPEGGSGTDGTVVILDDREDHSWSYYSDGDQPVHSLEPRDIKITYYGNSPAGRTTMTNASETGDIPTSFSATATGVKVNHDASESQFIYLKTLEAANADGSGNYPYTAIANPFQVRPTYEGETPSEPPFDVTIGSGTSYTSSYLPTYTYNRYSLSEQIYTAAEIGSAGTIRTLSFRMSSNNNTSRTVVIYLKHTTKASFTSTTDWVNLTASDQVYSGSVTFANGWTDITLDTPFEYDGTSNLIVGVDDNTNSYTSQARTFYTYSTNAYRSMYVTSDVTNYTPSSATSYTGTRGQYNDQIKFSNSASSSGSSNYRGFYAWRIKSLSSGLAITGKSVGDIIYPDEEITFETSNEEGNEVEFEALWAQAYVNSSTYVSNSGNYKNAYERNFKVGTTITTYNYPVTFSTLNPDGTGTLGSVTYNNNYSCSNDVKFENMTLSLGNNYLNGNNHSLIIGRGVANGNNNVAGSVYGYYNANGNINGFNLRIESGRYTTAYLFYYTSARQVTSSNNWKMTLGSDYDRAKGDNSKLVIAGPTEVSYRVSSSSASAKINVIGLSGTFGANADNNELYMGYENRSDNNTAATPRFLEVLGGNYLGGIAGGIENGVTATTDVLTMRIKGGTVHQYVYGAGQYSAAIGSRKTIITGGTFDAWVAGGCYGTDSNGNAGNTDGDSYIYFGGDANMTNTEGVFGGGYGRGDAADNKYTINKSFVVVADEAQIAGNVYGGGNKGYNTDDAEVYVLGGGKNTITVSGSVFGGANQARSEAKTTVTMEDGKVNGSLYGGANASGTVAGLGTVNMSGGTVTNVYGGGLGSATSMASGTEVNVSNGTINNNVYGGGEEGTVTGNTNVTVSGGTMKNVYGAGKGGTTTAQITGQTFVTVSGGTISESVYGGGEAGDVVKSGQLASTVTVSGGSIAGDVFGGGRMGMTNGNTEVDIKGGTIRGNVFGGAYGNTGSVYVAGTHSVNIMGGRIFSSVYGGSRNANDGLAFTGYSTTETAMSSVVNISAGQVDEQVYAAGYFGQTFGSVYVFVGKEAILNAPNHAPSFGEENENMYKTGKLLLAYSVWAGGDWGVFEGGSFGAPTVSGYSNIYVDGEGYDTETSDESAPSYMNIKGSLLGCGTSCDAGTIGRGIYVRNYGHANTGGNKADFNEPFTNATRSFFSIQRADTLIIDNSHINFTGQAKINSLDATEKYAIYSFDKTVRMTSGSSIFLNAPVFQIIDFWSATVDDLYKGINAVYTPIAYNGLGATGGPIDNKVRVNGGNYIEIYHDQMTYENGTVAAGYGMLNGFAHMMVAEASTDNTCAYARPKQCAPTAIENGLDNPNDGGWVSYNPDENTFSIGEYSGGSWSTIPNTGGSDQIPYENHTTNTKAGEQYFRIWRVGGMYSEREGVLNAYADGSESFNYVDVTIKLPAWRSNSAYYKFETSGTGANLNTTIDYGPDVMTYATAIANVTDGTQNWLHFVETDDAQLTGADANAQALINQNPNVNFGLVTLAGDGMTLVSPVSSQGGLIVCPESDQFLASVNENLATVNTFTCSDNTVEPQVTFRLTYSNMISTNMTWDPMFITLVQCDANGNITDIVKISLTINTYTTINNVFTTQTYAMMDGQHGAADTYTAKVILPTFALHDYAAEHLSEFTLTNVTFEPNNVDATSQDCWEPRGSSYDFTHFAMEIAASRNEDNSDGWNGTATGTYDSHSNLNEGILLGETGARTPFAFDFTLTYNGNNNGVAFTEDSNHPALLGVLTFTIRFTNYVDGDPNDDYSQLLTIKVQVIRRGVGKVFYLDGINGSNANSALYPNDAALSLSYIFNRCGYLPGDIIYIVNTVNVNKNLEWTGSAYNGVTIYRYPGGHPLVSKQKTNANGDFLYYDPETGEETTEAETNGVPNEPVMVTPDIVGNEDNLAFTGALVAVGNKGNLTIRDITLDGHMSDHTNPWTQEEGADAGVTATSPMITIASGGNLVLTNGTTLQGNNSTANGGAVAVNDGGTLMMNQNATITGNATSVNGGAVYMAGTMIVSDDVYIFDNHSGSNQNNVYLTAADKVVTIGTSLSTDEYGPLSENAKIGITKTLYGNVDGYTEVVNVQDQSDIDWLESPYVRPNTIIVHDGNKYQLEKYNDPTYLYWIGTWVTLQDHIPTEAEGGWIYQENIADDINNVEVFDIYTEYQLAWIISLVNGENGEHGNDFSGKTVNIHADIDMNESIWVPIGTTTHPFKGTFEGNGHVIEGIHSILVNDNAAMFGITEGATIQDAVVEVTFNGNSINKGTFIGTMYGGTLANVEAAGELIGKANTINMGGLVGLATTNDSVTTKPLIHSGFSVNTITAEKATTVIGGLVGNNGGDLYNSYANVVLGENNVSSNLGGLVYINQENCTVENCYVINPIGPAFACTNNGAINFCYAADGITNYISDGTAPSGHGIYDVVKERKEIGYMYDDNAVTKVGSDANPYIADSLSYKNIGLDGEHEEFGAIDKWPGLLSTLNQWVEDNPYELSPEPTSWFRPTSADINGDLPVLGFPKDNCLATLNGKFLQYSATSYDGENGNSDENGIDALLNQYNAKTETSYVFIYDHATGVEEVPADNVNVFINEKVALIQAYEEDPEGGSKEGEESEANFRAVVGITFENSQRWAGNTATPNCADSVHYTEDPLDLLYDWHMMSSPLENAPMGTTYDMDATMGFFEHVNITSMVDNYLPNGLTMTTPAPEGEVKWDLYSFYEPQYHWINLKRSTDNHWHYDISEVAPYDHKPIAYVNEEIFEPAKGYMMAISTDSYLSSSGKLNNGHVEIPLTYECSLDIEEKGCNLIGNPYHAYLDMSKFLQKNEGFDSYYVYSAEWNAYVPNNGTASENPAIPSRTLAPFQAFFVKVAANGKASFNNGMLTHNPDAYSQFRGRQNYPLVNLFAVDADGNRDLAVIEFNRPEAGGTEKLRVLTATNFELYARMNNENYSILFATEDTERVPVWFKTRQNGVYKLTWNTLHGNFSSLRLIDNLTGVNYDMLANDSYTFEASADDYASRFYITYTCTDVDENLDVDQNGSFAFFDGSEWVINGKGNLEVVDVMGRVLMSERLYNEQNRVNLNGFAKGVYLMRISDNKTMRVQKIVVR